MTSDFGPIWPVARAVSLLNQTFVTDGIDLDWATTERVFGSGYFNLIRRGADGSLVLSMDHWRLDQPSDDAFRFTAREADAPPLEVARADVARMVWDRLPKQQVRSQIRFVFANGDLWTFSGTVDESALPIRSPRPQAEGQGEG